MVSIKYQIFLPLILLSLLFSSYQISAQVSWSDDFEDGNLDDWETASFTMTCVNTCPWQTVTSTATVENGELVLDSTGLSNVHVVWSQRSSTASYGNWSYDMTMLGTTHDAFGISMTDLDNGFNLANFEGQITVAANMTGYVIFTVNYRNPEFDDMFPTPGIAIFKFLPNGSPTGTQDDQLDWLTGVSMADIGMLTTGSYHFDIIRLTDGNLTVNVDGSKILSIVDNDYSTSQKTGIYSWDGKTSYDNVSFVENIPPTGTSSSQSSTSTSDSSSTSDTTSDESEQILDVRFFIITIALIPIVKRKYR